MSIISPRVRFAPSPTGYLHIGGLRTALFNYLFAKNQNGKIILRIEDTDRKRFIEDAVANLLKTLEWAGIYFDEGPEIGGESEPYFQSQRLEIYKMYADELINKGKAYYAFDTPERLQQLREQQQKLNQQTMYDKFALTLSEDEVERKMENGETYVVRLNVQPNETIVVDDLIRGKVEFDTNIVDDQVLIKSDGFPTYHLANVVDDHLMGITHVIRGEEWLSSTPKHVLLYEYLGWEKPVFAHLPLLLNPDKSKLSKRQGDVAVEDYMKKGYLKEALINFVALLGWNPGDEQEFFTMGELANKFSLERVHKAGAVFNIEKLNWLNAEHLRSKPNDELLLMLKDELSKSYYKDKVLADDYLLLIIEAMKPRVSFVNEFITKCTYFYTEPTEYDEHVIKKRWKEDTPEQLTKLRDNIAQLDNPVKEDFENALTKTAEELEIGKGKLIHPVRLALSGIGTGPGVYDLLFIIGKDKSIGRIDRALKIITIPKTNVSE
ncbi:MAG: glutamate--tRNA ligase [Bacteroidetes bacterium]|nr:glutamate--tRNA ligase [Bacteroidota bacterium]